MRRVSCGDPQLGIAQRQAVNLVRQLIGDFGARRSRRLRQQTSDIRLR
jgi:hypothetical protein